MRYLPREVPLHRNPELQARGVTMLKRSLRIVAIGGITAEGARMLAPTGIAGVAVIRAILAASDPAAAVRSFLQG